MNQKRLFWSVVFAAILLGAVFLTSNHFWTSELSPRPAPDFTATDVDGGNWTLSELEGQPVLIDFMGTWCGPCQRSAPVLRQLQADYPDLVVLSVTSTDTEPKVQDFRAQYRADWPHIVDDGSIVNSYREAGSTADAMMWPSYAIVDADSQLVFYHRGEALPATFTAALDGIAERHGETFDAWPMVFLAGTLGVLSFANPFTLSHALREKRHPATALFPIAIFAVIGFVAIRYNAPVSGRLANVGGILALVSVAAVVWWRLRTTQAKGTRVEGSGWQHALALHGHLLYYAAPAWGAVLHAAFFRTSPMETLWLPIAFGIGLALGGLGFDRVRTKWSEEQLGWAGAAALLVGGVWNGLLYIR